MNRILIGYCQSDAEWANDVVLRLSGTETLEPITIRLENKYYECDVTLVPTTDPTYDKNVMGLILLLNNNWADWRHWFDSEIVVGLSNGSSYCSLAIPQTMEVVSIHDDVEICNDLMSELKGYDRVMELLSLVPWPDMTLLNAKALKDENNTTLLNSKALKRDDETLLNSKALKGDDESLNSNDIMGYSLKQLQELSAQVMESGLSSLRKSGQELDWETRKQLAERVALAFCLDFDQEFDEEI